ncbi:MAG: hypothetical protein RI947_1387 [Candidatus Parcubacteria bacterium]|jgi:hypothetical protein
MTVEQGAPDEGEVSKKPEEHAPSTEPVPVPFEIDGKHFTLKGYRLGTSPDAAAFTPGLMDTGKLAEVNTLYDSEPSLLRNHTKGHYVNIPYAYLLDQRGKVWGDFSSPTGQDEFSDADLTLTNEPFSPPDWAQPLWRFSELKQARRFTHDETVASLRGLSADNGKVTFKVGPGKYSEGFHTMGSEGVMISLTPAEREALAAKVTSEQMAELEELYARLKHQYGEGSTLRAAIHAHTHGLAPFNEQVYSHTLGVAGTVVTKDGEYVFVNRGAGVSINRGINVTASGAVKFDEAALRRYGIQAHLGHEMGMEAHEEIGIGSGHMLMGAMQDKMRLELGVDSDRYDLIPVGFARELPRGGSPEAMFLIRYHGTTNDLVSAIAANHNEDRREIDEWIYTYPVTDTPRLLATQGADSVIQHKGLLNLVLINEYMMKHG